MYPIAGYLTHLAQRFEHVRVEHLVAESPVEALDIGILIRLTWLDIAQLDMISAAPVREDL